MIRRVLDTSVAISWYVPEALSKGSRTWLKRMQAGDVEFIAPTLHALEFANVLRTYVRRKEIDEALARDIYALHMDSPIVWEDVARASILDHSLRYDATAYDASFIALALLHKAPLLTAEKTTTPWVVKLGRLAEVIR